MAWNEVHVTDLNFACAKAQQETRDRVFSEIMLLKQLKHKNILAMHDWWLDTKNSVRKWPAHMLTRMRACVNVIVHVWRLYLPPFFLLSLLRC